MQKALYGNLPTLQLAATQSQPHEQAVAMVYSHYCCAGLGLDDLLANAEQAWPWAKQGLGKGFCEPVRHGMCTMAAASARAQHLLIPNIHVVRSRAVMLRRAVCSTARNVKPAAPLLQVPLADFPLAPRRLG